MKKNSLDEQYLRLVERVMDEGEEKEDRTETGTLSIFGTQIRHKMSEGFPLLTSKLMSLKNIAVELNWFISGSTDIRDLWDGNCNIWDGDFYKRYIDIWMQENPPFSGGPDQPKCLDLAELKSIEYTANPYYDYMYDLGPIYGKQWTDFNGVNQFNKLVMDIKSNPDSRRLMVTAWNPAEMKDMVLPPCHYGFQCYTRKLSLDERFNIYTEKHPDWTLIKKHEFFDTHRIPTRELSLMWNQRSVDTLLGLPYNIASYGLLLLVLCKQTNCVPGELIGNLGDTHIYIDQLPYVQKQLDNETFELPKVTVDCPDPHHYNFEFEIEGYKHGGKVNYPLSN
jgi:thymidylate synthase